MSHTKSKLKQRKNNFVNRMIFDISRRENRDKTFDDIKDVIAMRSNPSRSISPRKEMSIGDELSPEKYST